MERLRLSMYIYKKLHCIKYIQKFVKKFQTPMFRKIIKAKSVQLSITFKLNSFDYVDGISQFQKIINALQTSFNPILKFFINRANKKTYFDRLKFHYKSLRKISNAVKLANKIVGQLVYYHFFTCALRKHNVYIFFSKSLDILITRYRSVVFCSCSLNIYQLSIRIFLNHKLMLI